jgi:Icc-related predicted phosphoesterase
MVALLLILAFAPPQGKVLAPPYVQLGDNDQSGTKGVTVVWHTDAPASAGVRYRVGSLAWTDARQLRANKVALGQSGVHYVQRAELSPLQPGARVQYEVLGYQGTFVAPKSGSQPFSFLAVGDIGRGTPGQRKLAPAMAKQSVDMAVLLGDIAYPYGRVSDYRKYFFPIQNADSTSPKVGAPMLRNVLSVGVPGNHDTAYRNLERYPDGLAFYAYWFAPVNGPAKLAKIRGSASAVSALKEASGGHLERLGNFSFSYGNSRWVVLDANPYVNWRDPVLRSWLEAELKRSQSATWSFVAMHAPPYHSSKTHAEDTGMRSIVDLFTKYKVDVMFAGHIHNYQRSFPLKTASGKMTIDHGFDGKTRTKADGTLHIISGGGGAEIYDRKQANDPASWQPFTAQFKTVNSFTRVDVKGRELILRQIDSDGRTVDQIRLTK